MSHISVEPPEYTTSLFTLKNIVLVSCVILVALATPWGGIQATGTVNAAPIHPSGVTNNTTPDFVLVASPPVVYMEKGVEGNSTIKVIPLNEFRGAVYFRVFVEFRGLPEILCGVHPRVVAGSGYTILTCIVLAQSPYPQLETQDIVYKVDVLGIGQQGWGHSVQITYIVTTPQAIDFAIRANPSLTLDSGDKANAAISLQSYGFSGPVTMWAEGFSQGPAFSATVAKGSVYLSLNRADHARLRVQAGDEWTGTIPVHIVATDGTRLHPGPRIHFAIVIVTVRVSNYNNNVEHTG